MKNKIKLFAAIVLTVSSMAVKQNVSAQPGTSVSFQVFYDNLSPYGQWVSDVQYGYVWVPEESGFRPYYSGGHWVMTDYGNMWVSDYPWGWAPFHYGRWTYDSFYGWVWIPGHQWGPAWVSWRGGADYYGWAPLGPGFRASYIGYSCPDDWWVFIPPAQIYTPFHRRNYYGPRNVHNVINNTTIINNTYVNNNTTYYTGPGRKELESATHKTVPVYQVRDINKPGIMQINKNEVGVYRPPVVKDNGGVRPIPSKVVKANRPIEKPQSVSINGGRPGRLDKPKPANNAEIKNNSETRPVKQQQKQNNETAPATRKPIDKDIPLQQDATPVEQNPKKENSQLTEPQNGSVRPQTPMRDPTDKQQKARQQQRINRQQMQQGQQREQQINREQRKTEQPQGVQREPKQRR